MFSRALSAATLLAGSAASTSCNPSAIHVAVQAPTDAQTPWQDFVSFSIEASSFPDFAGKNSKTIVTNVMCLTPFRQFVQTQRILLQSVEKYQGIRGCLSSYADWGKHAVRLSFLGDRFQD